MERPDIDWYTRRLAGLEGYAQRDYMRYLRVDALLQYIEYLERNHDNQDMHEV